MNGYFLCVALHVLAAFVWIGHMVFWSVVAGPIAKRMQPPGTAEDLRRALSWYGGLGWPALAVLGSTGIAMLQMRGLLAAPVGFFVHEPAGHVLGLKLALVAGMVYYQARVGHQRAPRLIYLNMLAAFVIVGLSLLLSRHPEFALPRGAE